MEAACEQGLEGLTEETLEFQIASCSAQLEELSRQRSVLAGLRHEQLGRDAGAEEVVSLDDAIQALDHATTQTEATLRDLRHALNGTRKLQTATLETTKTLPEEQVCARADEAASDAMKSDSSDMDLSDGAEDTSLSSKKRGFPRGVLCLYTQMGDDDLETKGPDGSREEEQEFPAVSSASESLAALPEGLTDARLFLSAYSRHLDALDEEECRLEKAVSSLYLDRLLRLLVFPACPFSQGECPCKHVEKATAEAAEAFQLAVQHECQALGQGPAESLREKEEPMAMAAALGLRFFGAEASQSAALSIVRASKNQISKSQISKNQTSASLLRGKTLASACPFGAACRNSHGVFLPPSNCFLVGFSARRAIEARLLHGEQKEEGVENSRREASPSSSRPSSFDGDWALARGKRVFFQEPRQRVWQVGEIRLVFKRSRRRAEGEAGGDRDDPWSVSWFCRVAGREVSGEGRRRVSVVSARSVLPALNSAEEAPLRLSIASADKAAAPFCQKDDAEARLVGGESGESDSEEDEAEEGGEEGNGEEGNGEEDADEALTLEEQLQQRKRLARLRENFGEASAESAMSMLKTRPRCPRTSWWKPLKSARVSREDVCPLSSAAFFGVWTLHTSGVGLQIMKKFGYSPGECLGRRQRLSQKLKRTRGEPSDEAAPQALEDKFLLHPLPIEILPHRCSLDFIRSEAQRRKAQKAEALAEAASRVASKGDGAFDLIRVVGLGAARCENFDAEEGVPVFGSDASCGSDLRAEQRRVHKQFRRAGEEETRLEVSRLEQEEQNLRRELSAAVANFQRHATRAGGGDLRLRVIYEKRAEELRKQQTSLREQKQLLERMLPSKKKIKVSKIF